MQNLNRVVVTGLGALTPIGLSLPDFWKGLLEGKSGAGAITKFDAADFKTRFACELKNFPMEDHFSRSQIKRYDPFTLYALKSVEEALEAAKLMDSYASERIGVTWGSGNGGVSTNDRELINFASNPKKPAFSPFYIPRMLTDIVSGVISMEFQLKGPNFSSISACASATTAIAEAYHLIQLGKADCMVTGGSEAPITYSTIGGFNALRALSTKNDNPENASRPFDKNRDGFVMGEGSAAIVLENRESAIKRGAKILAEVTGSGLSADAYHLTATHPEGEGAERAMRMALDESGYQKEDPIYLNAHATGTPTGDASEWKAIKRVFSEAESLTVSATKSMTGHLLGAAGAIEAVACIMSLDENRLPAGINCEDPDIDDEREWLLRKNPISKSVKYAMSNTFGFGGHVASIVFSKTQ